MTDPSTYMYDVALIRTKQPIPLNGINIQAVCLPTVLEDRLAVNSLLEQAGWGKTTTRTLSDQLDEQAKSKLSKDERKDFRPVDWIPDRLRWASYYGIGADKCSQMIRQHRYIDVSVDANNTNRTIQKVASINQTNLFTKIYDDNLCLLSSVPPGGPLDALSSSYNAYQCDSGSGVYKKVGHRIYCVGIISRGLLDTDNLPLTITVRGI
ncbi:uncharacterized protein LOC128953421 [Oppia nitens]|uniref:uncharacterized protein LOC128953421 n=1 Tax=Oppia nitens TaxID=1686743 RepID=UPI0023DA3604|nr:uncharacterized protein LOC128953421 [Oppia nitens]